MNNAKILVTGGTGLTGGHTVQQLLERKRPVRVLAHREDERSKKLKDLGAEVIVGDLLNLGDVRAALNGVQSAYFVYPLSPALIDATVIFAQAAKEAGVEIVANMSQGAARSDAKSPATIKHWLSEQVFDWSGLPVAHLQPNFFSEWFIWISRSIRQGVMQMPWDPIARFRPVAAEDLALVIAAILENPQAHRGKSYLLEGPDEVNCTEVAAIASRVTGRSVTYQQLSADAFVESIGLSGHTLLKEHCRAIAAEMQEGLLLRTNLPTAEISGRKPLTVEEFFTKNRNAFA
jgi:NAD(P)H dehydrogenase (quinone)